ncbi:MAG: hypothetical protein AVDCRST_MAG68-282, partial [uncultured Gemmatimonadetes bacterium]
GRGKLHSARRGTGLAGGGAPSTTGLTQRHRDTEEERDGLPRDRRM